MSTNSKFCTKCRLLLPFSEFIIDRSRPDGFSYVCRDCKASRTPRKTSGPSVIERNRMKSIGLSWCSGCKIWLRLSAVRGGKCRKCINAYDRKRFKNDPVYREERKRHAKMRRRGVVPVPAEGQEHLLEMFGGKCAYCQRKANAWDHLNPVKDGGKTVPGNIVPACVSCNSSKNAMPIDRFVLRAKKPHPSLFLILEMCIV